MIKDYIKSYEDWPVKGVSFKDISSLCNSDGFKLANDFLSSNLTKYTSESFTNKIIGIDARGFIFASVFADRASLPLVLARKESKLPGDVESKTYDLEYGEATIEIKKDSINLKDNVIIIDDLCATGGTILATIDMVNNLGGKVIAVGSIIDLPKLGGSDKIKERNIPFYNAVTY
jgi:adenine phosphoribosyltransferase